jgi:hypothetical protein
MSTEIFKLASPLVLPYPFDEMKVTPSSSTQGRCYAFCLTSSGKFYGYDFPQGYRIRNHCSPLASNPKLFFLECRSFKVKALGLLAAIIPLSSIPSQKEKGSSHKFHKKVIPGCELVVVRGITPDAKHIQVHAFKRDHSPLDFASETNIIKAVPKYFDPRKVSLDSHKVVYLNSIAGNPGLIHPHFHSKSHLVQNILPLPTDTEIEGSSSNCDVWFEDHLDSGTQPSSILSPVEFISKKRFRAHPPSYYQKKRNKKAHSTLPWLHQQQPSDLIVVTDKYKPKFSFNDLPPKTKVYFIPYRFGCHKPLISFAPILNHQFAMINRMKSPQFERKVYRKFIRSLLEESGLPLVEVLRIIPGKQVLSKTSESTEDRLGGSIISLLPTGVSSNLEFEDKSSSHYCETTGIEGIHIVRLRKNIPDFQLPFGGVSIFRGYIWPYATVIPDSVFQVLATAYTKKGLTRNSVPHKGNFEMIGSRMSNQSTGSMISFTRNAHLHEYNRSSMNSALLPLVRGYINGLQQESLKVAYSCGESLMPLYKRENGFSNPMDLCEQTIITQGNFCNVVHIDKSCRLHDNLAHPVIQSEKLVDKERLYLDTLKKMGVDHLPKSTTCAWTLRASCPVQSKMFQYFVSSSAGFAYDVSSYNLEKLGTVGATFNSSIFDHCTSIPVWVSEDNSKISLLPSDKHNYNFAWGSNGGKGDKEEKTTSNRNTYNTISTKG